MELGFIKQKGGKTVYAWATEGDVDVTQIHSNTFEMEWPPRSGKKQTFPEIDKAEWFTLPVAKEKILEGQVLFLERFVEKTNQV
jgi:predicted NUDIX family NTP pyrophosphohydrolase